MKNIANTSAADTNKLLERKLHAAMKYAHDVCILGAGNRIEDIKKTGGWVFAHEFRYHPSGRYVRAVNPAESDDMKVCNIIYNHKTDTMQKKPSQWYYRVDNVDVARFNKTMKFLEQVGNENPIQDSQFTPDAIKIFGESLRALSTRAGSCGAQAFLVTKFLWEHPDGIKRIEGVSMLDFDHVIVVVNREGDISKPETWGDAWIIDPWAMGGMIYRREDVLRKIAETKAFCKREIREQQRLGFTLTLPDESRMNVWEQVWEIKPGFHLYPSYSKDKLVEDYYSFQDYRFKDNNEYSHKLTHKLLFWQCRGEIVSLRNNKKWAHLFKSENSIDAREQNLHDSTITKKARK